VKPNLFPPRVGFFGIVDPYAFDRAALRIGPNKGGLRDSEIWQLTIMRFTNGDVVEGAIRDEIYELEEEIIKDFESSPY